MGTAIETVIVERLHRLDDHRQAEALDFMEHLATKSVAMAADWPEMDPSRVLAKCIGVATGFPEDVVACQRQIRDAEWP